MVRHAIDSQYRTRIKSIFIEYDIALLVMILKIMVSSHAACSNCLLYVCYIQIILSILSDLRDARFDEIFLQSMHRDSSPPSHLCLQNPLSQG